MTENRLHTSPILNMFNSMYMKLDNVSNLCLQRGTCFRPIALVIGLFFSGYGALTLCAENDSGWQDKMVLGLEKYKIQDYVQAEKLFKDAYRSTKNLDPKDPKRINSEIALGDLYRSMKRYPEAEQLYGEASASLDKPGSSMAFVMILNKIAGLYKDEGKLAKSEETYKRSLDLVEKICGKDDVAVATISSNLAMLYQGDGRLADAEQVLTRATKILAQKYQPGSLDYAQSLYDLASVQMLQKNIAKAIINFEQALKLLEAGAPPDDLRLACCLDGLGTAYASEKRYAEAEALARRALKIYEQKLGQDNMEVSITLSNLGYRLLGQDKLDEAVDYFQRSLAIQEKKGSAMSFETIPNRQGLAEVYAKKHDYKKCEAALRALLSVKRKRYGDTHIALVPVFINLGNSLAWQDGKQAEAELLFKQAETTKLAVPAKDRKKIDALIDAELIEELRSAKRFGKEKTE